MIDDGDYGAAMVVSFGGIRRLEGEVADRQARSVALGLKGLGCRQKGVGSRPAGAAFERGWDDSALKCLGFGEKMVGFRSTFVRLGWKVVSVEAKVASIEVKVVRAR